MRLEDFIGPNQENMNVGIGPVYDSYGLNEPIEMQQPQVGQVGFASEFPSAKEVLGNMAKNAALNYVGQKVGLPGIGKVMGFNSLISNPIGLTALGPVGIGIGALTGIAQNSLFGRSATIADYLEAKRAEKAAQKVEVKELQDRIDKGEFGSVTPTPQDKYRADYSRSGDRSGSKGGDLNAGGRESYGGGGQYR